METHSQNYKIRLGIFVLGGLALFAIGTFIIGKQKNLFNPVFSLYTTFYNVSGLQVGCNIRFSGTNVGTVDNVMIINDSTVKVEMLIRKEVKIFIKNDCRVAISTEGLMGDKLLLITQGSSNAPLAKDGQFLASIEPVEIDDLIASLSLTAAYVEVITENLAEVMLDINGGKGTISRLIKDSTFANDFNQTLVNLKRSSKGLDENMQAAKHNFLLRGYYKNKNKKALQKGKEAKK